MLINLSNHPFEIWDTKQKEFALSQYNSVHDINFPYVSPEATLTDIINLASKYIKQVVTELELHKDENNAVHLMGEFTFTYNMVDLLRVKNIPVIASTTKRTATVDGNGNKTSIFSFVGFRPYF